VKVRGVRAPALEGETDDTGIAITGEHAELQEIFETIFQALPATEFAARELAVRCLAVLSKAARGVALVDGLDAPVLAALAGLPDDEPPEGKN
jgi:hypothetical protein